MTVLMIAALCAVILELVFLRRDRRLGASGKVLPPPERTDFPRFPSQYEVTAAHEAGHAILAWVSPFVQQVTRVVLNARGGITCMTKSEATSPPSPTRQWDEIAIDLAGIAAEGYAFGRFKSYESRGDLRDARQCAERLVRENPSPLTTCPWTEPEGRSSVDVGRMFAERPDERVCAVLNIAYRHAKHVVELRPDAFRALTDAIHEKRWLNHREIEAILGPRPWVITP